MWTVILRPRFLEWLDAQPEELRVRVYASITLLEENGPNLARPYADTLKGSKLSNLKELRVQHGGRPIRALYVFDPIRRAVILCAGDKSGKKRFYVEQIPIAENEYEQYLLSCRTDEENQSDNRTDTSGSNCP